MGPLTLEARQMGLDRILGIQAACTAAADLQRRPRINLINAEEEARIRALIAAGMWPDGWEGDEPSAEAVMPIVYQIGAVQPLLFSTEDA